MEGLAFWVTFPAASIPGHILISIIGSSSGFSLFSPQGLEWITQKTGSDELLRFLDELAVNVQASSDKITTELYRPLFASEREPLPPKHIADRYVDCMPIKHVFLYI